MHAAKSTWIICTLAACIGAVLAAPGCALIRPFDDARTQKQSLLNPLVPPRQFIELDVYFVDRLIGDPLIGEGLWSSLFAVTAVSPEVREQLTQDGFRFAMSPSRPPRTLQTLMKLSNNR